MARHEKPTARRLFFNKHLILLVKFLEASPGIEPGYKDLQSSASPLRHEASHALQFERWRAFRTNPFWAQEGSFRMCCFLGPDRTSPGGGPLSHSNFVFFCIFLIFQKKQRPLGAFVPSGRLLHLQCCRSNTPKQNQDQDDDKNEPEATRWAIAVIVVTPAWQSADQEKNEQDNEDGAEHV